MTAKKTTKKTAKNTIPSTKKTTVPKLKKKSVVEKLAEVMVANHAKTEAAFANWETAHAKTEAAFANWEAAHAKTEATVDRVSKEVEKLSIANQKNSAEFQEARKVLHETLQRTLRSVERMSQTVDELSRNLGRVNNKLGSLVEYIVIPQIRHSINAAGGHSFIHIMPDTKIRDIIDDEKRDIAQIDVFLYNDTETMAVEIKTDLHVHDVNDHIKRLKKLRKYEEKLDLVHKKLFGAVVGVVIDSRAKTLALENGLYVVKIREDEELLDIEKPDSCQT